MQVVINQETKEIICLNFGSGHCQDFSLFKKSNVHFNPETDIAVLRKVRYSSNALRGPSSQYPARANAQEHLMLLRKAIVYKIVAIKG